MPIASIKTYLDQIDEALTGADATLDEPQRTELSSATRERRTVSGDSTVEQISNRLVAVFTEADETLQPGQIEALEAHVSKRLAVD
jgi:hypothetical protein